jgi:hypothetical protein
MAEAGYPVADRERVGTLLRKEEIKRDAEVQALGDVICSVLLRWSSPTSPPGTTTSTSAASS